MVDKSISRILSGTCHCSCNEYKSIAAATSVDMSPFGAGRLQSQMRCPGTIYCMGSDCGCCDGDADEPETKVCLAV